jgi:hypothetical protein
VTGVRDSFNLLAWPLAQDIETALNRKATWIKSSDPEQFEQMFEI